MSEYRNTSDADLATTLAAIESLPAAATIADAIRAEQAYRIANAAELAARAELVVICRSASETLAKIRHSTVAAISDPNGTIVKNARLTLLKLLAETFDVTVGRAEKIIMVLMDEHGQTAAAGDVEKAAAYVEAHPTGSTVYTSVRPDDPSKGSDASAENDGHANADTLDAAVDAGEKTNESRASK